MTTRISCANSVNCCEAECDRLILKESPSVKEFEMQSIDLQRREQLIEQGFCVIPNVLDPAFVQELREVTDRLVDAMSADDAQRQRSTGSMIPVVKDPRLVKLIAHRGVISGIEAMG